MKYHQKSPTDILRMPEVLYANGMSASTYVRHEKAGYVPKKIQLSARTIGIPRYESEALAQSKILGFSNDERMELVRELHDLRLRSVGVDVVVETNKIMRKIVGARIEVAK